MQAIGAIIFLILRFFVSVSVLSLHWLPEWLQDRSKLWDVRLVFSTVKIFHNSEPLF